MAAPAADPPCGLCSAAAAPYTCPRCHLRLCSLRCYRAHGGCAEAFYRRQVLEALEAERGVPPPRLPPPPPPPLREAEDPARPTGRGLWAQLSPAERAGFRRLLGSGEAAAELLPPWRPWWWRRQEDDDEEEDEEDEAPGAPPPFPASIPALSSLRAPPPSPLLPFQLPNVLYGYAFALSLHAGDESLLPELPAAALDVSAALRSRCSFASAAEALHAARRAAAAAGYPRCPLGDAGTVLAVAELLADRDDAAAALGHLAKLLKKGSRRLGPEGRSLFGRARRKCRYLLAWSRQAPAEVAAAAEAARRVHAALAGEEAEAAGRERGWGGARPPGERRLVQELD